MKFLTQPCGDCPFRLDQDFHLHPERAAAIGGALANDGFFQCHKEVARVTRQVAELERARDPDAEFDMGDFYDNGAAPEPELHRDKVEPAAFCGGALHYMNQNPDMLFRNMITRWAINKGMLPYPMPSPCSPVTSDITHLSRSCAPDRTKKGRK
jgi:hypothetical protein